MPDYVSEGGKLTAIPNPHLPKPKVEAPAPVIEEPKKVVLVSKPDKPKPTFLKKKEKK